MQLPTYKELLDAGAHFGHMKSKWNPKMASNIFMERKGIHIIDLNKTSSGLERACTVARNMAKSGKKIMFVATKKQAKTIVADAARRCSMPYVTERWLGGMMTNFSTIRRSVKKMNNIDQMLQDGSLTSVTKKERLTLTRERNKLERVLGGIAGLNRLPAAVFIVDTVHEHIALAESNKLGLRTFAVIDTNADPTAVDFPIPANDDASKTIELIANAMSEAIREGLNERKQNQQQAQAEAQAAG